MPQSKVDISVVIVNYNVKDFLLQCLLSVRAASKNLSVQTIVVDNDSRDGSVEFLKPQFPEVEFIALDENIGFGKANNVGFGRADGEYILILNPDTVLPEDNLRKMKEFMDRSPEVGIAGCKALDEDGSFQPACRRGFPTPWAAFSKLFGLQKLFPKSKLFGKYNQTFRDVNETYHVDSVIGAYMFCRRETIENLGGFDPDYFMYGEDLDLCLRAAKAGMKTAYFHETTVVHYKGESTKRSSINEVKHFYKAMEIFAKKHYSSSALFLLFIRFGIWIRSLVARISPFKRDLFLIVADFAAINAGFFLAAKIKTGAFLQVLNVSFPFANFAVAAFVIIVMFFTGEYFERNRRISRSLFAYMISFFVLSSLELIFERFFISRAILIGTVGFSAVLSISIRIVLNLIDKLREKKRSARIAVVGTVEASARMIKALKAAPGGEQALVGIISPGKYFDSDGDPPVLGNLDSLPKILDRYNITEVIFADKSLSNAAVMSIIDKSAGKSARFSFATEFEELLASRIIGDVAGKEQRAV